MALVLSRGSTAQLAVSADGANPEVHVTVVVEPMPSVARALSLVTVALFVMPARVNGVHKAKCKDTTH